MAPFENKGLFSELAHASGPLEKEIAAPAATGSGEKSIEKAANLQAESYFRSPSEASPLPQIRAAHERDRAARERLGLSIWGARS